MCIRDRLSAALIAEQTNISEPTVAKVLKMLLRAGLVVSVRGAAGGYRLLRPAREVSVVEIIEAIEGPIALKACVDGVEPGCGAGGGWIGQRALESMELLIVDDATHYDLRAPQARNDYFPLAWVSGKGLLALERSNLRSKLVLVDRSEKLNMLPITEFGFEDTGFCASSDGLTLAWLRVEDSNGDGFLNPWPDNSRPWFVQIAPRYLLTPPCTSN